MEEKTEEGSLHFRDNRLYFLFPEPRKVGVDNYRLAIAHIPLTSEEVEAYHKYTPADWHKAHLREGLKTTLPLDFVTERLFAYADALIKQRLNVLQERRDKKGKSSSLLDKKIEDAKSLSSETQIADLLAEKSPEDSSTGD
jgi:hypothetical protein